jgi:hypothetical protein
MNMLNWLEIEEDLNRLPFFEKIIDEKNSLRRFNSDLENEELKWHFDEEDRIISPIGSTDWFFQFDNKLPQKIEGEIFIEKGEWHRLIKGNNDLILLIKKLE